MLKSACTVFLFCAVTAIVSVAGTFTTLVNFSGTNGNNPFMESLVQGKDGGVYGTTTYGGTGAFGGFDGGGTIFEVTPSGTLATLYNFCSLSNCTDGSNPEAGLVLGTDGNFYGTTSEGGTNDLGTVFKVTSTGTLTILHNFAGEEASDGSVPSSSLVQGTDGNFYGTTQAGGADFLNNGTAFKITPTGTLTLLHSFDHTDGLQPYAGLIQGTDGNFYGTTAGGGANNFGTVFKITPAGAYTLLHSFDNADGWEPEGVLVQGASGDFYGTTLRGGANTDGTTFEISSTGTFTSLHSFDVTDGAEPVAGLIQATDGNFYGTAVVGGANSLGTIFQMTPAGVVTTLHSFSGEELGMDDGASPFGGLVQQTTGVLDGVTSGGGTGELGTVFSLDQGLAAFVETVPTAANEGVKINILGQGFTSSSVVKFDGVQATAVTLNGDDLIATVPAGALTGLVTVTTGSTTLTSNLTFRVTPQVLSFTPTSGPVGTSVTIMGVGLKQTLGVGFGDYTPAKNLKIVSDTEVTATVPMGAKTGPVGAETKGGIGISSKIFTVTP